MPARRGRGTRTSSFGSTGRFGHDSTTFYAGRLYDGLRPEKAAPYVENPVPADTLDTVIRGSSERMAELPDNSVHLMVTSPPYNVGKDYDEDLTLEEYTGFFETGDVRSVPGPGSWGPGLRKRGQPGTQALSTTARADHPGHDG